jgi:predicted thioesterase
MKTIFKRGDKKHFRKTILPGDVASFETGNVHPVYATFALGRDAEWVCRLFVLEMKDEDEEGIGTFLNIEHIAPALVGQEALFEAEIKHLERNDIICTYTVSVGERIIAKGEQGQKILKKEKILKIFESIR